jgi:hypothetical protein
VKTKNLNILRVTKNVLLAILISGTILEAFFRILLGNIVAIPDTWRIYNYVLAVIALPTVIGIAFIPSEERINKAPRRIKILRTYFTIRELFFLILGIVCGFYFFGSFPLNGIDTFNKWFRFLAIAFIGIYPCIYDIVTWLIHKVFSKPLDSNRDGAAVGDDLVKYITGLVLGVFLFIAFEVIMLIVIAGIFFVRGIIWLIHFIHDWGFLFYLYI